MQQQEFIERFDKLTIEMKELVKSKNQDYSWNRDAFQSLKLPSHLWITSTECNIFNIILLKISRISNLLNGTPKVETESVKDSLIDLCNYWLILLIYIESENEKVSSIEAIPTKFDNKGFTINDN